MHSLVGHLRLNIDSNVIFYYSVIEEKIRTRFEKKKFHTVTYQKYVFMQKLYHTIKDIFGDNLIKTLVRHILMWQNCANSK